MTLRAGRLVVALALLVALPGILLGLAILYASILPLTWLERLEKKFREKC